MDFNAAIFDLDGTILDSMLSTSNKEVYGTFRNYLEIYFMILENNFDV